ncbi:MAG: (4Fe-4S)-binding protein, partial [Anaerolineales bacterium]|nr:(4Fe-4S)-binding protein [Anaerolineales bacterium]
MSRKTYTSSDVDVSFDAGRCIHAAECVKRLPAVFDTKKRPWIQPDQANADEITAVVERCPSGALQYQRHDKAEPEQPDPVNTITLQPDGPLYVRRDLSLELNGETQAETRL